MQPTRSEIDTFKILANSEFANIRKPEPTSDLLYGSAREAEKGSDLADLADLAEREERDEAHEHELKSFHEEDEEKFKEEEDKPNFEEEKREVESLKEKDSEEEERLDEEVQKGPSFEIDEKIKRLETTSPEELARLRSLAAAEISIEKEALLYEIQLMEKQGLIKLQRTLTMEDSLESIQYQYDRANMIISTQQSVEWTKNGIKMGSTMLETVAKKFGVNLIDGFSNNLCKDMKKFDQPLTKLVRKYWRKGSSSPEMELGMIIFSSLAMTVITNKTTSKPAAAAEEPSSIKLPSFGSLASASVAPVKPPVKLPEWAKNAMNAPLPKVEHFAKAEAPGPDPEFVSRGPPNPVFPVLQTNAAPVQSSVKQTPAPMHQSTGLDTSSVQDQESTKRIVLSPKSQRRRRETVVELNLDA